MFGGTNTSMLGLPNKDITFIGIHTTAHLKKITFIEKEQR